MEANRDPHLARTIHALHDVIVAGGVPLFLGALLSDWAYATSYQVQWTNFASWLIAGGLVFTGLALVWAMVDALRSGAPRRPETWIAPGLLAATFVLGFLNALVHAKDAWAAMPAGLILSVIVFLLALAATWSAHPAETTGERA